MNMPGFSAQASLYKSSGHYWHSVNSPGGAVTSVGLAQQSCLPRFTSCQRDPSSSTGCSRCHVGLDCEIECGFACTCPPPPSPPHPVNCGNHMCAPGQSCCGAGCCRAGSFCCNNVGCCKVGDKCRKFLGKSFCSLI